MEVEGRRQIKRRRTATEVRLEEGGAYGGGRKALDMEVEEVRRIKRMRAGDPGEEEG